MRRTFAAAIAVAALAADAAATTSYGSTETLVGWSTDGRTWATINEDLNEGSKTLALHEANKTALTLCDDEHAGCDAPLGIDAERVDLAGHPRLRGRGLARLERSWRTGFDLLFELEADKLGDRDSDTCTKKLRLAPRFPWATREIEVDHCLAQLAGGYLHPGGGHALIKVREAWIETDDVDTSDYDVARYIWVEL
jgi:hypothetical protein